MPKSIKKKRPTLFEKIISFAKKPFLAIRNSSHGFLARRPHRSFRLTKKRDYKRSFNIEGYFAFTSYVRKTLWANKRVLIWVVIFYAVLTGVLVGMSSQDTYTSLTDSLNEAGSNIFSGDISGITKAGLLFINAITGGMTDSLTEVQQFYAGLIFLFTWLTTVWLLRNLIAGHKVKFRDGLYSSLSPLVSTFLVALVIIAQLIPVAIALLGYSAASSSGILYSGVESMLFWIAAIFLGVMSLYWITSTFIALVVITLPGMYPFVALKTAGDLVVGRRIKMLLRLLWMALILLISWAIVVIPIIMLESWLSSMWSWVSSIPVVPFTMLLMSSFSVTWASSYIYLLYRKIVADDSAPA